MPDDYRAILDYRRHMTALYAAVREGPGGDQERLDAFRLGRDRLLLEHPHSPLLRSARERLTRLAYYSYEPGLRFTSAVTPDPVLTVFDLDGVRCERVGWVEFAIEGTACRLALFWIRGHAGGLFMPFTDATTGRRRPRPAATCGTH